jgi:hypothetical protein
VANNNKGGGGTLSSSSGSSAARLSAEPQDKRVAAVDVELRRRRCVHQTPVPPPKVARPCLGMLLKAEACRTWFFCLLAGLPGSLDCALRTASPWMDVRLGNSCLSRSSSVSIRMREYKGREKERRRGPHSFGRFEFVEGTRARR